MEKVAEFYARWFVKPALEYWAAEVESEELANDLLRLHESTSEISGKVAL
jgi:hypothetical protein